MSHDLTCYLATIEGIGTINGQTKYCYGGVPDYATTPYSRVVASLADSDFYSIVTEDIANGADPTIGQEAITGTLTVTVTWTGGASTVARRLFLSGSFSSTANITSGVAFELTVTEPWDIVIRNATGGAITNVMAVVAVSDSKYIAGGLAEPPEGSASVWNVGSHRITVGRFSVILREGAGPVSWYAINPVPISELAEDLTTSETDINHALTNTDAGVAVDTVFYVNRETFLTTAATGASTTLTASRGQFGSTAAAQTNGADMFLVPPALTGRLVTVYEVQRDAASSASETVILRGYIEAEPASGVFGWVTLSCVERFDLPLLNFAPKVLRAPGRGGVGTAATIESRKPIGGGPNVAGGYWMLRQRSKIVVNAASYSAGTWSGFAASVNTVYNSDWDGGGYAEPSGDAGEIFAGLPGTAGPDYYPILFSDTRYPYPSFGYLTSAGTVWNASDNPVHPLLNIMLSSEAGTNYDAGDARRYDLGPSSTAGGLAPEFGLGIDRDLVDLDEFERVAEILTGIHADRFWLGGPNPEDLRALAYRLLAPWGYAVGTRRTGIWTILSLGDVYPTEATVDLTREHVSLERAVGITIKALGRSLDRVVLECDPTPDGEGQTPKLVEEVTGRDYYPRNVGREERFENAPYSSNQFVDNATGDYLIANRVRRLSSRVQVATIPLTSRAFDLVDVGTLVTVNDYAMRDPTDGGRLVAGDAALKGIVSHVQVDWYRRQGEAQIVLTGTGNTTTMAPSAKLANPTNYTAPGGNAQFDVEQHNVTRSSEDADSLRFPDGCVVALTDSRGVLRSDDGLTQTLPTVNAASTSATQMVLVGVFVDTGGATVTPAAGNWVVPASWDAADASSKALYAWCADGGAPASGTPGLGAADEAPFVIGD